MDESRKRGEATPSKDQWHKDEGPAANLGATGVFGAEPSIEAEPDPVTKPVRDVGEAPQFHAPGVRERLQEPIVHKVVLGGGSATAPIDILGLIRTNSPAVESAPGSDVATPQRVPGMGAYVSLPTPVPAPTSGSQPSPSSEGFTQLLRTLSGDSPPASAAEPTAVKRTVVSSDSRMADSESGFTSLLRTLNPDDGGEKRPDTPAPSRSTPSSERAGGFTALLQGFSETGPKPGELQPNPRPLYENPVPTLPRVPGVAAPLTAPAPAPDSGQPTPGTFTQLFSALTPEAKNPGAAERATTKGPTATESAIYPDHNPVSRPSGKHSFTQLISTIAESSSGSSLYSEERQSILDDGPSRRRPAREAPLGSNQLQTGITDWSSTTAPRESSSGSGGLTQLLRTLDQPSKASETPQDYAPKTAEPEPPQVGTFTGLHRLLDAPADQAPPAPHPSNPPSSQPSATEPHGSALTRGSFKEPATPIAAASNPIAGPSEYTQIVNMSQLREIQRPGVSGAPSQINSAAVAQPLPSQTPAAPTPTPPSLQWPPQAPPTPAPWPPQQFGGAMQPPQFTAPTPMPHMPAPAAPPAMSKMQQHLPLMLIMIIFLLVVILVTMVFLLKH
jgi:hypothetical protein